MELTLKQYEQLVRIFNTLMKVYTNGENSFIMTDCLRAYRDLIFEIGNKNE